MSTYEPQPSQLHSPAWVAVTKIQFGVSVLALVDRALVPAGRALDRRLPRDGHAAPHLVHRRPDEDDAGPPRGRSPRLPGRGGQARAHPRPARSAGAVTAVGQDLPMGTAPTIEPGRTDDLDTGLDAAVRAFRTAAWCWLAVVTVLSFASIERPVAAAVGVLAAGVGDRCVVVARPRPRGPHAARRRLVGAELLVGAGLVSADGWVFDDGRAQSFGGVWPLAGVLAVAVRGGRRAGVSAGLLLGRRSGDRRGRLRAGRRGRRPGSSPSPPRACCSASPGGRRGGPPDASGIAERLAARSAARAEVAAELHDGVLQTLAVVQRRSDDDDLVRLARSQEAELRRYLAGPGRDRHRRRRPSTRCSGPPLPTPPPGSACGSRSPPSRPLPELPRRRAPRGAGVPRRVPGQRGQARRHRSRRRLRRGGRRSPRRVGDRRGRRVRPRRDHRAGHRRQHPPPGRRPSAAPTTLESRPGSGTTVTIDIPLEAAMSTEDQGPGRRRPRRLAQRDARRARRGVLGRRARPRTHRRPSRSPAGCSPTSSPPTCACPTAAACGSPPSSPTSSRW